MGARESAFDRGGRNAMYLRHRLGTELRDARRAAGLSQGEVARASALSQSQVSRAERAVRHAPRVDELARHAAVLGLRLSVKLYPEGSPVRDAGQLRLMQRFRRQLPADTPLQHEVPIGGTGDLRAWDLVLGTKPAVAVDAETRLHDLQALQRRCATKLRDSDVDRLVLLVAATPHNRLVLREHRLTLETTFPLGHAQVMASLRHGRAPAASGIVVL